MDRPTIEKPTGDIPFELGIDDISVGEGAEAVPGSKVTVHYVGVSFSTGEEFDASWNRGQPFQFKLGKGQVIPGWDQGVAGVGGVPRPRSPSSSLSACSRSADRVSRPLRRVRRDRGRPTRQ